MIIHYCGEIVKGKLMVALILGAFELKSREPMPGHGIHTM